MSTSKLASHTQATVLNFLETASKLERRLDRSLSVRGISFSEFRLLRALSNAEATGLPRIDLANSVGLTASAVTRALKPLEKIGCVSTRKNERDARQSLTFITQTGLDLLQDAQGVLDDVLRASPLNSLNRKQTNEFQDRLLDLQ